MARRPLPPPVPAPRTVEEAHAELFSLNDPERVKEITRITNLQLKEMAVITVKQLLENKDGDHKMWIEWIEFTIKSADQVDQELDDEEEASANARQSRPAYDADEQDALDSEEAEDED